MQINLIYVHAVKAAALRQAGAKQIDPCIPVDHLNKHRSIVHIHCIYTHMPVSRLVCNLDAVVYTCITSEPNYTNSLVMLHSCGMPPTSGLALPLIVYYSVGSKLCFSHEYMAVSSFTKI